MNRRRPDACVFVPSRLAASLLVVLALLLPALAESPVVLERVNLATDGTQANNFTETSTVTHDGRYVAFVSSASNLVTGDTNGANDVFVRDTCTHEAECIPFTIRASVSTSGTQHNGFISGRASISDDGRYVAFVSNGNNLVSGDTNGNLDVFLRDTCLGAFECVPQTLRVSLGDGDVQGNSASSEAYMTRNARHVVFASSASNLVAGDTNNSFDIFVRRNPICLDVECPLPTTERVSLAADGSEADNHSFTPMISEDGRFVVFRAFSALVPDDTNGATDIYVRDTCYNFAGECTPSTFRISVSTAGIQGNSHSSDPAISDSGRFIAFASNATNLAGSDTNGTLDVFLRDTCIGAVVACTPQTVLVSATSGGSSGNSSSGAEGLSISADGRFVTFNSFATDLVTGDTNGRADIFVRDTCAGLPGGCTPATVRVNLAPGGLQATGGDSRWPVIASGGRYVVFVSFATNLVADDTNGTQDVFLAGSGLGPQSWWRGEGDNTDYAGPNDFSFSFNQPGFAQGAEGQAFSFDFTWFEFPDTDLPLGASARSLEFWMNSSTAGDSIPVLYGDYNTADDAFFVALVSGTACIGGGTACGSTNVLDGAWHHVRLVYDGAAAASLYVDGVLEASEARSYTTTTFGTFWLGAVNPLEQYYTGLLDEVKILPGNPAEGPDIAVSKSASADPVLLDTSFDYVLTVTNNGPGTATSVALEDVLPVGVTFVSVDNQACFNFANGQVFVICELGTLAATDSVTVTITVTAAAAGALTNTAFAAAAEEELNLLNNAVTIQTVVAGSADLGITKTASASPVIAGVPFQYTLTVVNNGPEPSVNARVTDVLPAGISYLNATPSQGTACTGTSTVTCNLGVIAPQGTATVILDVVGTATGGNPVNIDNTATVSGFGVDAVSANDTDSVRVQVRPGADLGITKTASTPARQGGQLTYTVTVVNFGPDAASGVSLTDTLPANVTLDSVSSTQGTCSGTTTITCDIGAMNVNDGVEVTIVVTPTARGSITNTASVSATQDDPNTANNSSSVASTVVGTTDYSVDVAESADPVTAGNDLTHTVTVTNNGPSDGNGPVLTVALPLGSAFQSATPSQGTCSRSGITLTCNPGPIAADGTASVAILLIPVLSGTATTSATVAPGVDIDLNSANNSASASTTVNPAPGVISAPDSKGTEFWIAFMPNAGSPTLSLFITGDEATAGLVEIPGLSFSEGFTVTPGQISTVVLPSNAVASGGTTNLGIHISALKEVTVYALNRVQFTTDAFLALPTDILGTEYLALGYVNSGEMAVVAGQDATNVTVTLPGGAPQSFVLNQGQVRVLTATDVSGALVTSDKPVAVFGGASCTNIPPGFGACDHIVEQLPPTTAWGKNFVTMPLATRLNGDTFRFLASVDGTNISVNGTAVATLNRGQFHESIIAGPAQIIADQPILVAQYSNGTSFDNVTSDPFMMLIPPFEQFLGAYTVATPATGFSGNFINVVAPAGAVGGIVLDGTPIPAENFTAIGSSGFSGTQVAVGLGSHNLSGPLPFGVFVYGFADFDSYGYPGGASLSAVASVASLTLAPSTAQVAVGNQHCVTATVRDSENALLPGIRVDFLVTGVHPASTFGVTNTGGEAQFCYTGEVEGADTIQASVGTLSSSASVTWVPAATADIEILAIPPPQSLGNGSLKYSVQVRNNGPSSAAGVTLTDTLSPNIAFIAASASQGSCSGGAGLVQCSLGSLNANATATVDITVAPPLSGWSTHTLSAGSAATDPVPGNNLKAITQPENGLPQARAGSDRVVSGTDSSGASVTLDGSASSDPDGDTLTYRWSGPFGIVTGARPTVTLPFGVSTLTLVVSDGKVDSAPAEVRITVSDFGLGVSPAQGVSVRAGQSATYTISLSPQHGAFDREVLLSCSGLPARSTCSFSQVRLTPGGNTVTATLTVSTAGQSARLGAAGATYAFWMGGLPLAGMVLLGIRSRRRRQRVWLMLALALLLVAAEVGCGGGNFTAPTNNQVAGTPAGSYGVVVTGSSGNLSHSTTANMTVQ